MKEITPYPQKPLEPVKPERQDFNLLNHKKEKIIYRDCDVNGDVDDSYLDEMFDDQDEERPPIPEQRYWEKLSLQDIINLAPPGTDPRNIILHLEFPRDYYYTDLYFTVHERDFEAEEAAYQEGLKKYYKDKEKYDKELPEYEKQLAKFHEWEKQEEIDKLEKRLSELKKKLVAS